MNKPLFLLTLPILATTTFAQLASDNAANYASWTDGSNQGTGFGAWALSENNDPGATTPLFAGHFLGDSTAGAGDLNTSGQSFGMYANPTGAFATASRSFATNLAVNDQFTFEFGVNFDNGNKGFNLFDTGGNQALNFNLGSGASVNSAFTLNSTTSVVYDYGGGDALLSAVLTVLSFNTSTSSYELAYEISRVSNQGAQGVLYAGTVDGISGALDAFEFYVSDTDAGGAPANNLYFNNLAVTQVPEPSAFALVAGIAAAAGVCRRRL